MKKLAAQVNRTCSTVFGRTPENGWKAEDPVGESLAKMRRRAPQYKALVRKTKVAILGGAFDPITKGHIALASFVLNASKSFDEVWIMPCFRHVTKRMASSQHRLEMCRLAAQADGRIKVFDYEIRHHLSGETCSLVKHLLEEKLAEQYEFSIIIGQDNANNFDQWVNYGELERIMAFVVVPRKGVKPDSKAAWYLHPPHMLLQPDNEIPHISSTAVRSALQRSTEKNQRFLQAHIAPAVLAYIRRHHLYRK